MSGPNTADATCVHCGHWQEPAAKYCGGCGISCFNHPLPAARNNPSGKQTSFPSNSGQISGIQYAQATTAPLNQSQRQPLPFPAAPMPPRPQVAPKPQSITQQIPATAANQMRLPASAQVTPAKQLPIPEVIAPAPAAANYAPLAVSQSNSAALFIQTLPSFAQVHSSVPPSASQEMQAEAAKLIVLLARERLCLLFHIGLFVGLNFTGFALAQKCYTEFVGDELTKIMMACTPFTFINVVALICIIPIIGTRKEIARLKERISYVRFKMDYGHLI